MHPRLFLPASFIVLATTCVAQSHHGPRLGLSLATQSVGGLFQNTSNLLPAPVFGWGMEIPMHPQFIIMPELLWLTKGAVVRNQAQDTRSRSSLHYLELPVMVKIGTDATPGGMFLSAGPSLGYFVSGKYKSWLGGDLVTDQDYTLAPGDKRGQFSMAVGLGFDQDKWTFEMRAQTSLTPFSVYTEVQNIVYQFVFAWRFPVQAKEKPTEAE